MLDVLVVDDDDIVRESIAEALALAGHRVDQARDGEKALAMLADRAFELVVCDVQMPNVDGLTLFRRLRHEAPGTSVVLMTSFGHIPDAVGTLRDGAVDYVTKPFDPEVFADDVVAPIAERRAHMQRFEVARRAHVGREVGVTLVRASQVMRQLTDKLAALATSDAAVILSGEPGTGKKLAARTLHASSPRRDGPFVVVPCASLAALMAEAELRHLGSTGVPGGGGERDAWFRAAEGGTLVLDGLESLSLAAQATLVRVLDERATVARRSRGWEPLGVRVVGLTSEDPATLLAQQRLLDTLYFRLGTAQLRVPALRERRGDLYELVTQLLRELTPPSSGSTALSPQAWTALTTYPFPANVGELRWVLARAVAASRGGEVGPQHLPATVSGNAP